MYRPKTVLTYYSDECQTQSFSSYYVSLCFRSSLPPSSSVAIIDVIAAFHCICKDGKPTCLLTNWKEQLVICKLPMSKLSKSKSITSLSLILNRRQIQRRNCAPFSSCDGYYILVSPQNALKEGKHV